MRPAARPPAAARVVPAVRGEIVSAVPSAAACGSGAGDRGVGAGGQREDGAAAVVDRRGGPGRARRVGAGAGARSVTRSGSGSRWRTRCASTAAGSTLVRPLTAAPDLDGWAIVERLLTDLAPLEDRLWLVIDDVHELGPDEALRQLELLVMRAPPELRFVLATRHDLRLGLHRLRLEGELTEIRAADLRFSLAEARELFAAAGVELPSRRWRCCMSGPRAGRPGCGWRRCRWPGTRIRSGSRPSSPAPSGRWRNTCWPRCWTGRARQVRRLLLRTSVLERVNGELADLLTGGSGGERILQDLEQAGAFVVSLDARRSWFRYHQLFADLLQLELRRTAPGEVAALHGAAAGWFAEHGYPVEAVRHAQAAQDWGLAARLLADHWLGLHLDGQAATVHELLAGFPAGRRRGRCRARGAGGGRRAGAGIAGGGGAAPGAGGARMRRRCRLTGAGSRRCCWPSLRLFAGPPARRPAGRGRGGAAAAGHRPRPRTRRSLGLGEELRALALISLGITESGQPVEDAERHLEQGVALARRIGRPYLEFTGLAYRRSCWLSCVDARAAERSRQAIELAERHGWTDEPVAGDGLRGTRTPCWSGRGGWRRQSPGSSAPSAPSERRPSRRPALGLHYARGVARAGARP